MRLRALAVIALTVVVGQAAELQRCEVIYRDGTAIAGETLSCPQGWSLATSPLILDEKPLERPGSTIRTIRRLDQQSTLQGAFLQLANGDYLPGRIAGIIPADEEKKTELALAVYISTPLLAGRAESGVTAVSLANVLRIVSDHRRQRPLQPGTIWLADGRVLKFNVLRWGESEVKILSETEIIKVKYRDIEECHFKNVDRWAAIRADFSLPCMIPESPVMRLQMSNGAVITCREADYFQPGNSQLIYRPAWAPEGIIVESEQIVSRSYQSNSEVPLSILASTTLSQRSFLGYLWQWQPDRNVYDGPLRCGKMVRPFGIGMHSYTAIAFELPPTAKRFTTWVGLDEVAGKGGCVHCSVRAETADGRVLWERRYLRGADGPQKVDSLDVSGVKQLVLVVDFGHEGRPAGADPLDIRDALNWLDPVVTVDEIPRQEPVPLDPMEAMPALTVWEIPAAIRPTVIGAVSWNAWAGYNGRCVYFTASEQVRLKRRIKIDETNAWFEVAAGRGMTGVGGHKVDVWVNGKPLPQRGSDEWKDGALVTVRNDLLTETLLVGQFAQRAWSLGQFAGQEIDLEVVFDPVPNDAGGPLPAVALGNMQLHDLVWNKYDFGGALIPEVGLAALPPTINFPDDGSFQPGRLPDGKPLSVCDYPFATGYAIPAGGSVTYELKPEWTRFVTIIGFADGNLESVGPFEVLLDDELVWDSRNCGNFARNYRAYQVAVTIPLGKKRITLRVGPKRERVAYGAWLYAGFLTTARPVEPKAE